MKKNNHWIWEEEDERKWGTGRGRKKMRNRKRRRNEKVRTWNVFYWISWYFSFLTDNPYFSTWKRNEQHESNGKKNQVTQLFGKNSLPFAMEVLPPLESNIDPTFTFLFSLLPFLPSLYLNIDSLCITFLLFHLSTLSTPWFEQNRERERERVSEWRGRW